MKEALRVAIVLMLGALVGALALAVLLLVLANADAWRPLLTDFSLQRIVFMSLAFCLFTFPIALVLGLPIYLLIRRFRLLRVSVCAATGAVIGIIAPYRFRLSTLDLSWQAILWFAVSGAVAGGVMGYLLRQDQKLPKLGSQT
jgi:hypothetical protein